MSPLHLHHYNHHSHENDVEFIPPASETKFQPRRRVAPTNSAHDRSRDELQHNQRRPKRREPTAARERGKPSIHLESAPWLGYERALQARCDVPSSIPSSAPPTAHRQQRFPKDRDNTSRATTGSSRERTQSTTRDSTPDDSMLSDTTRSMLHRKAVQISHSLVRRASQMAKSVERSRVLAAGSRRSRRLEIEGYRFVHTSKAGVALYEDATAIRLEHKTSAQPRYIGVMAVKATLDEFVDTFGRESAGGFAQLNPDVTSSRDVHAVRDEPNCRVGVKWIAMQPALARRRDFVVLECDEVVSIASPSTRSRRGWVQSMHSVQLPWCPSMERSSSIVRGSMYQTGTVALESETSSEWLHVVSCVEIDLKGSVTERAQRANALRRLESLDTVAAALQMQRLQRMSLLHTKQFHAAKPGKDAHCSVCTQRIGLASLRLHHYCRKCAASVCGRCSRTWQLDATSKKKTRVCENCVVAARPSRVSGSSWADSIVDSRDERTTQNAPVARQRQVVCQGEAHRSCRAQTLPTGLPTHGTVDKSRSDPDLKSTPQVPNRGGSLPVSRRRTSRRYFDLPMDASELGPLSDDDDDDGVDDDGGSSLTNETICPFSDTGVLSTISGVSHRVSSAGHPKLATRAERTSATRMSQTVTEEDDDDEEGAFYDSELGYSVGPSCATRSTVALSDVTSTPPQETYERDQLIHL